MTIATEIPAVDLPRMISGNIIAENVSLDDLLANYDGMRVEWTEGFVIEMAGIDKRHAALSKFFLFLFSATLEQTTGGDVFQDPMLMVFPDICSRAPDLQVILPHKAHQVQQKNVLGASDLIVEIVSQGSQNTDRVDKFGEYARASVPEYWIIDPIFKEVLFYVLNEMGEYERIAPVDGVYTSKMLPQLKLPIAVLWQDMLPNMAETMALVQGMLNSA